MTIISASPNAIGHETPVHLKAKMRVARIVDQYLESIKPKRSFVHTEYEYQFLPIQTPLGERAYIADIFTTIFIETKESGPKYIIKKYLDVEIDGKTHWSEKNQQKDKMRDEELKKQYKCPVMRISMFWVMGVRSPKLKHLLGKIKPLSDKEILDHLEIEKQNVFDIN